MPEGRLSRNPLKFNPLKYQPHIKIRGNFSSKQEAWRSVGIHILGDTNFLL
jgi:hypothetical protein